MVFNHDDSDFACAFVLGTYISQPKNDLLYIYPTKDHAAIYVDVGKLKEFLCKDNTTNHPKLLYSSQNRLNEFVSRTLDIVKLTSQKKFVSFSDVHRLIAECAKSP